MSQFSMPALAEDPSLTSDPGQTPIGGGEPVSDEQKQQLLDMISGLKGKQQEINAIKKSSIVQNDASRQDALVSVFDMMKQNGVDPSDQAQVSEFLQSLAETSPELYQIFEEAFGSILGDNANSQAPDMGANDPNAQVATQPDMSGSAPDQGTAPAGGVSPDLMSMLGGMGSSPDQSGAPQPQGGALGMPIPGAGGGPGRKIRPSVKGKYSGLLGAMNR